MVKERKELTSREARFLFGIMVRMNREQKLLSCHDLAEKAYLCDATVIAVEKGRRKPTIITMKALTKALDIPFPDDIARAIHYSVPTKACLIELPRYSIAEINAIRGFNRYEKTDSAIVTEALHLLHGLLKRRIYQD